MLLKGSKKLTSNEYREHLERARRNGGATSAKLGGGANTSDVYHRKADIRAQVLAEEAERRRRRW